jgi:hypothetical protein
MSVGLHTTLFTVVSLPVSMMAGVICPTPTLNTDETGLCTTSVRRVCTDLCTDLCTDIGTDIWHGSLQALSRLHHLPDWLQLSSTNCHSQFSSIALPRQSRWLQYSALLLSFFGLFAGLFVSKGTCQCFWLSDPLFPLPGRVVLDSLQLVWPLRRRHESVSCARFLYKTRHCRCHTRSVSCTVAHRYSAQSLAYHALGRIQPDCAIATTVKLTRPSFPSPSGF